jgi:hypothetical protein
MLLMKAVALALELDDLGPREETVEDGGCGGDVAEKGAPVLCGSVRGNDRGGGLVTAHEDLEQILGRAGAEPLHAEVLDDQDVDLGEPVDEVLALAQGLCLDEVLAEVEGAAEEGAVVSQSTEPACE